MKANGFDTQDQATNDECDLITKLAELLSPMFVFIARGRDQRTRDMRLWVVLYAIDHGSRDVPTIEERAERDGVDPRRLRALKSELHAMIPALQATHDRRPRERADVPSRTTPGKESLYDQVSK